MVVAVVAVAAVAAAVFQAKKKVSARRARKPPTRNADDVSPEDGPSPLEAVPSTISPLQRMSLNGPIQHALRRETPSGAAGLVTAAALAATTVAATVSPLQRGIAAAGATTAMTTKPGIRKPAPSISAAATAAALSTYRAPMNSLARAGHTTSVQNAAMSQFAAAGGQKARVAFQPSTVNTRAGRGPTPGPRPSSGARTAALIPTTL
jgi:hypothetical protein